MFSEGGLWKGTERLRIFAVFMAGFMLRKEKETQAYVKVLHSKIGKKQTVFEQYFQILFAAVKICRESISS